jgi:cytochrome P450
VIITKPDLVRQVLSNKFGHFERADGFGQVTRLLHYGLSIHEGSKWAKHRRIINPAFHLHKLKVSYISLTTGFELLCQVLEALGKGWFSCR